VKFFNIGILSVLIFIAFLAAGGALGEERGSVSTASWCRAKPGDTAERLTSLMGSPKYSLPTQMTWLAPPLAFYAFLDADGTVKQLDINAGSLSDAQKASLPCDTTRTRRSMMNAAKPRQHPSLSACQLVSAAEMTAILGSPVIAKANDQASPSTRCAYRPASEIAPSVELTINWGDGAAAMRGAGLAEKHEKGVGTSYDGLGDQAVAAGPLLMIRTGEDLMTILFSGVSDTPAKAKKIFDTAKARM
jgi:hypothetical protein